mgnify:FL=1
MKRKEAKLSIYPVPRRSPFRMAAFITAGAVLSFCPYAVPAMAASSDGHWQIEIVSQVGKCEASIAAQFTIRGDDITSSKASTFKADGSVQSDNSLWVRLQQGKNQYRLQGKLKGRTGSGSWSSNTRFCGGIWRGK